MKIGLFGGTFNPVHHCHVLVAEDVRDRLQLDRMVFIPSGDPPHKPSGVLVAARHRVEMVRLAIEGRPGFSLSLMEVERKEKSYTIETIRRLRDEYGAGTELFFLTGLDAFLDLPGWKDAAVLLRQCRFVVMSRPPFRFGSLAEMPLLPPLDAAALEALDGRQQNRLDVAWPEGHGLILLSLPPCEVSASEVRRRLHARLSVSNLLPTSVESYIMRHQLYQEESDRTGVEG